MNSEKKISTLSSDLPAGLVVFLVALPLCLGIALASGAPLISGIIAGIVGGLVVSFFSESAIGVSGPAAGLAVIVLSSIQQLGSFEFFLVAVVLAGFFQILFGYLRAGIIAYYFPSSVISGMLAGIGILIILKQIPHALGLDDNPEGQLAFAQPDGQNTFMEISNALHMIDWGPLVICSISLLILLLWETNWIKKSKINFIPGALLAVFSGAGLSLLFQSFPDFTLMSTQLVQIPVLDSLNGFGKILNFPDWSILTKSTDIYEIALIIAVVASIETLLCVEATDKIDPQRRVTPTNKELKAQGIGNIISGLIGGLPITQVIVRSSANVQAGAKTKKSAIIHAVFLLLSILSLGPLINLIPLASLAAILFVVGYKLAKPALFKKMWAEGPAQYAPFLVTIAGIVLTDLLAGVFAGLVVAILGILYQNYKLPFSTIRFDAQGARIIKIVLSQQVTFLHKASMLKTLSALPDGAQIYIDGSSSTYIHPDIKEIIHDFALHSKSVGQKVFLDFSPKKLIKEDDKPFTVLAKEPKKDEQRKQQHQEAAFL